MATVRRTVAKTAAQHVTVQRALAGHSEAIATRARAIAATHSDSGDYARSFGVERDKIDWFVVSTDPDAMSKEFGRTGARGRGASKGVHALTKAANGEGG
jgi:hypothetical protein